MTTTITLSEHEQHMLQRIALQTGKTESEVLHEAVQTYAQQFEVAHRRQLLQQARGMWRERTDLPDLQRLRAEWDHSQS